MIDRTCIVGSDALIDEEVTIGPFCVVGVDGPDDARPAELRRGTIVRSHSVIYRGVCIGDASHIGHGTLIRENTTIGDRASIGSHSVLEHDVEVGDGARLHSRCFVPEHSLIGEGAWLGPGVIVTNARYPNQPDTKDRLEGVVVEPGAVVGAGVLLLPGVRIGAKALVGAGAVVVRDVEPETTVVGNPASVIPR